MNNLIKITIVLLALTAVILTVSCACKVQTPKPEPVKTQPVPEVTISDDELGLRISHGGGMGGVATKLLLMPREGFVLLRLAKRS